MFRWGIMGGGFISSQFAKGIESTEGMTVQAVASVSGRNPFGIRAERYCNSYEALAEAKDIDGIYVGTIHPLHFPCVKMCLEAGKAVLCEKPVAMNAGELKEMIALAEEKNVFFMEAMWSRYLPAVRYVREQLAEGVYGVPRYMHITFGNAVPESNARIHRSALGGGALLDVGVYGINLAEFWLPGEDRFRQNQEAQTMKSGCFDLESAEIHSWAVRNGETADLTTDVQMLYHHDQGKSAVVNMTCSVERKLPNSAHIVTEQAEIYIPCFWKPDKILINTSGQDTQAGRCIVEKNIPMKENGYQYEALEVKRCVEAGLKESPDMTWEDSLRIMRKMDIIRSQCGIRYPQDR